MVRDNLVVSAHDIHVVPPERWMIEEIAQNLRQSDIEEFKAGGWEDPSKELIRQFEEKKVVFVAKLICNQMLCCVGLGDVEGSSPITKKRFVWIAGTEAFNKVGVGGMLKSLYYIKQLVSVFGHLYTFVADDNRTAQRYIKALGFKKGTTTMKLAGKTATYWERIN